MTVATADQSVRPVVRSPGLKRYVVRVVDNVDERLAGHGSRTYTSPAQPLDDALTLAGLLLGGAIGELCSYRAAIAGGQRTVTVEPAEPTG